MVTVRQQVPLGLGHAIWCARAFIGDDPFAILLPDDLMLSDTPCLHQLADAYRRNRRQRRGGDRGAARADQPLRHPEDRQRRRAAGGGAGLVEKPAPEDAPSNLSIIGRYVLMPEVIADLARMERGAGNEVQLTDAMAKLIGQQPFHGLRYEGRRFDCGDKIGLPGGADRLRAEPARSRPAVRAFLKTIR